MIIAISPGLMHHDFGLRRILADDRDQPVSAGW
jgi:hypothetical protein